MTTDGERKTACATRIINYILEVWADDPAKGFEAVLTGDPDTPEVGGAAANGDSGELPFWSLKAQQIDLLSLLLNRLITDLEKSDLYPLWTSGGSDFDRDVVRALWQIDGGANDSFLKKFARPKLPAQATAMAQVIGRYQDLVRKAQSRFSRLDTFPGALVSHSHDPLRLRRAGKAEWIAFIHPRLDGRWLEGRADLRQVLDDAWELIVQTGDVDLDLRFKEADGWTEYNQRFGFGTLREAVVAGLERGSRRAALLEVFGPEPEHLLDGIIVALQQGGIRMKPEDEARLKVTLAGLAPVRPLGLHQPALELEIAENAKAELIDLAGTLFPEPGDLPALAKDIAFGDTTLFSAIDADLKALAAGSGVESPEQKVAFTRGISIFCRALIAMLVEDFEAGDNPPGRATALLRYFLKLNVFGWWRGAVRRAALLAIRLTISDALKRDFSDLEPKFTAALGQYGVTAAGWAAVRGASSDAAAAKTATDALQPYLWERLMFIMLEPDTPNHAGLGRGAADLTAEGELLRFMAQFRDFRAAVPPKPLANLAADRESDRAMRHSLADGDVLVGMVNVLLWLMLLYRLTEFADDPQKSNAPSWFKTAETSGALGLCADFLFGETTGLKLVPLSAYATVQHPAIASALEVWHSARYAEDVRAALAEWAKNEGDQGTLSTLQITRQTLNYALQHHLQDMMSPGSLRRALN